MTLAEVTGILGHEIVPIRNNDAWAMTWAAATCHTIALTSHAGAAMQSSARIAVRTAKESTDHRPSAVAWAVAHPRIRR
jgi:hypothetical protein